MRILIVKLSSLGDVVHAMPAVQDIREGLPKARIDWVVENSFAPLVRRCAGVHGVIGCELRRWRKAPFAVETRAQWHAFREQLGSAAYDAVIDLQGLTKSAIVARVARLAAGGKRFALANRTDGSSYEIPTRWVADVAIPIQPRVHAVARSRELCRRALGYTIAGAPRFGLTGERKSSARCVAFVHGSSREDKCWPENHWLELGRRLTAQGHTLGLPHGSDLERERAERLAAALGPRAEVWPRLDLGELCDRLAECAGVVGVDSGLSHIAVGLGLPHVQIYNFDTAWRTGPVAVGQGRERQLAVYARPTPSAAMVWEAWLRVAGA